MNDKAYLSFQRTAVISCIFATLPVITQLPMSILIGILCILILSFYLNKALNRPLVFLSLLLVIVLMILEYRGRLGRDVATSMLALMMSLKCLESKSIRDLRAILGFSIFLPFAALLNNQSPLTVALSILNFSFWMLALNSISTGKLNWPKNLYPYTLKAIGMQVLFAVPLALALFWLFPRISSPLWGLPSLSNQGSGLGDSMKPGQWLDSLADDRIAFRVTYKNKTPKPNQRYWRGPVLSDFDGVQWSRTAQDSLPTTQALFLNTRFSERIEYDVSLEATEKKYIPSLDLPYKIENEYYLSEDGTVYSDKKIQKITRYFGGSILNPINTGNLTATERARTLAFPTTLNKKTQALALQWRAQAGSDRAYIERVMQWIKQDFSYTLATEEPGINSVDDFLFTDKKGFCQHFSSSFAILMRAAGIPSRVVTGYVGGYKNPYGDYWILYQKDAHAWNEVWLQGEGWVRFDPTASIAPENILDTIETASGGEQYFGHIGFFSPFLDFSDLMKTRWNDWVVGFNAARQEQLFKGIGFDQAKRWQLILFLVSLASAISYLLFLYIQHRNKELTTPLDRAWQKLLAKMHKQGLTKFAHETALDFALRMQDKTNDDNDLQDICQRYSACRYANIEFSELQTQQLIADILVLSKNISARKIP